MKFHINEQGEVKPCNAQSPESCPVKDINGNKSKHYENKNEALENSQKLLKEKFGETKSMSKNNFIPTILKNSYIGVPVSNNIISEFEKTLKNSDIENIDEYMENRKVRDLGHYHCTIITPREFRQLKKSGVNINEAINKINNFNIDFIGVGSVEDKENNKQAWYVVADSEDIDNWRNELNLPKHNLHITLAFKNSDIHNLVKDNSTLINI